MLIGLFKVMTWF